jgi:L-seryl-tRNA(Ser) seleniumtransferase
MEKENFRKIPSIDAIISSPEGKELIGLYGRDSVIIAARRILDIIRLDLHKKSSDVPKEKDLSIDKIVEKITSDLEQLLLPSLKRSINAAGVVLHTGLGRAVLPESAIETIREAITGYCTLATDTATGRRGHRDVHLSELLCKLTGAEEATVVNNNAAATVLILNTLAKDKEVIISRGQLVEIGGSFRMPDVMKSSGAIMAEVGTTNKTHLKDYASAITENTGAILRVHHSNYKIMGFSEEPSIDELIQLGREHNIPVIDDLGSGALVDLKPYGVEKEPMVRDSIEAGVDVACFSGDKLIGGPQSGVIVGKTEIVNKIKKNPLARAFRIGKMTIAGMEATLKLFLNPEKLEESHPSYRMFSYTPNELEKRAKKMVKSLGDDLREKAVIDIVDGESQIGSGSVPIETLPSRILRIEPLSQSAEEFARKLRQNRIPVFTRIQKNAVMLDFRTISPDDDKAVLKAILNALKDREI